MDYTITLTDTEQKSMEFIAVDVNEWITNAAKVRASKAKDQIIAINAAHCNANSIAIAVGSDAQVAQAYSLGLVSKATDEEKGATS